MGARPPRHYHTTPLLPPSLTVVCLAYVCAPGLYKLVCEAEGGFALYRIFRPFPCIKSFSWRRAGLR